MTKNPIPAIILGSSLLFATHAAQAACVYPVGFPPNDVSLDAFAFELASASPPAPNFAYEVDMNGIQRGIQDERRWATHGTLVVTVNADFQPIEWIASWTQNTYFDSSEWVCRLKLDQGGTTATGDGAVTSPAFFGLTPRPLRQCRLDLVNDCTP